MTGVVGEQWSAGYWTKFQSQYQRIEKMEDGQHGYAYAKGHERAATKMHHQFAVYPSSDPLRYQMGQPEDYLVQIKRRKHDYRPVRADIFEKTYVRLKASTDRAPGVDPQI